MPHEAFETINRANTGFPWNQTDFHVCWSCKVQTTYPGHPIALANLILPCVVAVLRCGDGGITKAPKIPVFSFQATILASASLRTSARFIDVGALCL